MISDSARPGQIVILNGAPRSGKSSIATVIQDTFDDVWMNLGVDAYAGITPPRYHPGIGLRPGGERPDLEALLPTFYAALFDSIAAHSRLGLNVVADLGLHDSYARPLDLLPTCARLVAGLPVLFVAVRCSLEAIMERRRNDHASGRKNYIPLPGEGVPAPILLWQEAVHRLGRYDLEVDTSSVSPEACAEAIRDRLRHPPPGPTAFGRLAGPSASDRSRP